MTLMLRALLIQLQMSITLWSVSCKVAIKPLAFAVIEREDYRSALLGVQPLEEICFCVKRLREVGKV
jgi:hypothetical protein